MAYEDLVRGYEVEPETYVFLETEEIERARPSPSSVIDLEHFVRLEEIDPVYFEKAYYVAPGQGAEKSYGLLLRTLTETGRVGIGRFVLGRSRTSSRSGRWKGSSRSRRCTSATRSATQLRSWARPGLAPSRSGRSTSPSSSSRRWPSEWDPSQFADEYREGLLRMIAERTPERIEEEPSSRRRGRASRI